MNAPAVALQHLIEPGAVFEIRIPEPATGYGTVAGYFDNPAAAAEAAAAWSGKCAAVYITPNPVKPELLARACNRLKKLGKKDATTADADIVARRWLLVDLDPVRPAGISSSDPEHAAALVKTEQIRDWLASQGWPAPILADSGNGAHLLYRIDLPNDDAARALVKTCLEVLASKFDDRNGQACPVKVDTGVFNASRIWKLYGTLAAKGDNLPERPHRLAWILKAPEAPEVVAPERLRALASLAPQPEPKAPPSPGPAPAGGGFFAEVNARAMANLPGWVPALLPDARPYRDGYRVTSKNLRRDLEEDLSIQPDGIVDFGVADLGDAKAGRRTPIDLVIEVRGGDAKTGALWLCGVLGIAPESLGWRAGQGKQEGKARPEPEVEPDPDPVVKVWPNLPPEALHGLAGDVVRLATQDCEADPSAVLATFLTWFGAACGRPDGTIPFVSIGETRHPPRLFAAIVGASARARKGTSKTPVQRVMVESQRVLTSSSSVCPQSGGPLSSGEGIIYRLRDPGEERDKDGELSDPGSGDKRLMVVEGELGGVFKVMQREGSIVSTVLREAWDGAIIEPLTKNNRIKATNPHLCIVGHITRDELKELLTQVDLRNGLANRFLWCMARRTRLISRPCPMHDGKTADLAARIGTALVAAHDHPGQIAWTSSALVIWDDLYEELTAERPGAWGYATARAEAQVQRLALIYCLLDAARAITPNHLKAAHAFWRYCDASAGYLFAESEADPIGNKILEALRAAGGEMSQTEVYRMFSCNMPAAKLAAALTLLQEHGRVAQVQRKTGGRPAVVWSLLSDVLNSKKSTNKERF